MWFNQWVPCASADRVAPLPTRRDLPRGERHAWRPRPGVGAGRPKAHRPRPAGAAGRHRPRRRGHGHGARHAPRRRVRPRRRADRGRSTPSVPPFTDFVQQEPQEGQPATEKTEVWLFFDDANIYIGARLHESDSSRRVMSEMRRDSFNMLQQRPPRGAVRHLLRPPQRLRLRGQPPRRAVRLDGDQRAAEPELERPVGLGGRRLRRRLDHRDADPVPLDPVQGRQRRLGRELPPDGALEERDLVPERACRGRGAGAASTSCRARPPSSASRRRRRASTSTSSRTRSDRCSPTGRRRRPSRTTSTPTSAATPSGASPSSWSPTSPTTPTSPRWRTTRRR